MKGWNPIEGNDLKKGEMAWFLCKDGSVFSGCYVYVEGAWMIATPTSTDVHTDKGKLVAECELDDLDFDIIAFQRWPEVPTVEEFLHHHPKSEGDDELREDMVW